MKDNGNQSVFVWKSSSTKSQPLQNKLERSTATLTSKHLKSAHQYITLDLEIDRFNKICAACRNDNLQINR